jgi:tartrate dehydrogenase/decarboxylase/D-malate dehydrogenase
VPDDFLATLRGFDAILLGALGWPARLPDSITIAPLIQLRQAFGLYANVRPARTFRGVLGPLRCEPPIDLVVVRENSEGEYVNSGGTLSAGTPDEVATQTAVHTRRGIERILRFALHLARTRTRRLAMITKSNAQPHAYGLWDRILAEVAPEFADVAVEKLHVDAAALHLVRRPQTFDVIVGSNLFGDILSDLTGGITGSLGLNPSANLDPQRRSPSLFEPVHGSAPDIAGKGIANPVGAILSAAMMLEWLGQNESAASIRRAVDDAIGDGHLTPDMGGRLTMAELTRAIVERVRQ